MATPNELLMAVNSDVDNFIAPVEPVIWLPFNAESGGSDVGSGSYTHNNHNLTIGAPGVGGNASGLATGGVYAVSNYPRVSFPNTAAFKSLLGSPHTLKFRVRFDETPDLRNSIYPMGIFDGTTWPWRSLFFKPALYIDADGNFCSDIYYWVKSSSYWGQGAFRALVVGNSPDHFFSEGADHVMTVVNNATNFCDTEGVQFYVDGVKIPTDLTREGSTYCTHHITPYTGATYFDAGVSRLGGTDTMITARRTINDFCIYNYAIPEDFR